MKRTLAFLMTALFLTMLLIGCGTTTTESGKNHTLADLSLRGKYCSDRYCRHHL